MAAAQRAMTAREWSLLALLSLLWGGSFFFVGVAVRELPPLTLVTLRVGCAALGERSADRRFRAQERQGRRRPRPTRPRQQRPALCADRLGADASAERPRLDSQRRNAALHRPRRACPDDRGKAQPPQACWNRRRNGRRRLAHGPRSPVGRERQRLGGVRRPRR